MFVEKQRDTRVIIVQIVSDNQASCSVGHYSLFIKNVQIIMNR